MALTVATLNAAITGIIDSGQSFTQDGITYTAANLSSLIQLRDDLQEEAGETGTRPMLRGVNFAGMGYSGT